MTEGNTEAEMLDDGYAVFDPPTTHDPTRGEPNDRYFAVVVHKPASAKGDPIPFLAAIYRGELVETYWRGTRDEAEDALTEYLSQRVSSDD